MSTMNKDLEKVLAEARKLVEPSDEFKRNLESFSTSLLDSARKIAEMIDERAQVELVGSVAKGTYLESDVDIDIFVLFPLECSLEEVREKGLRIGKEIFERFGESYELRYAEHPYISGRIESFEVNIVPAYRITSYDERRTAVDRTMLHLEYIRKNLPEDLKTDVRLLKSFLKNLDLYGAEVEIEGFSGYLCELLVLAFRGFENLVKKASEWHPPVIIDLENHYGGCIDSILRKFENQPLIVVDPVDPNRNVAAALSRNNFFKFVAACKLLMSRPSMAFFKPSRTHRSSREILESVRSRGTAILILMFPRPEKTKDIVIPQLRKIEKSLSSFLESEDFKILTSGVHVGDKKAMIVLELDRRALPSVRLREGPSVLERDYRRVERFLDKYLIRRIDVSSGPDIRNGYWMVFTRRKLTDVTDIARDALSRKKIALGKDFVNLVESNSFEIVLLNDLEEEKLLKDHDLLRAIEKIVLASFPPFELS